MVKHQVPAQGGQPSSWPFWPQPQHSRPCTHSNPRPCQMMKHHHLQQPLHSRLRSLDGTGFKSQLPETVQAAHSAACHPLKSYQQTTKQCVSIFQRTMVAWSPTWVCLCLLLRGRFGSGSCGVPWPEIPDPLVTRATKDTWGVKCWKVGPLLLPCKLALRGSSTASPYWGSN